MHRTRAFAVSVASVLALLTTLPLAAAQELPSGITVTGMGSVNAEPDLAAMTFSIVTTDNDAATSSRDNAVATAALIDALTTFPVPRDDIKTVGYAVSPVMDYKQTPATVVGYRTINSVRVKLRDLAKTGELIDTAMDAGATSVQGINFTVEDDADLKKRALARAVAVARSKAVAMAEALDVKLGKVKAASESVGATYPRPFAVEAGAPGAARTPVLPGQVMISATVTLVYPIL